MGLPKLKTPTMRVKLPSTGEDITLRAFLVKEEKIFLMAKESGEGSDIFDAVRQIVNNCVLDEDFVVDDRPIFDLEYLFIKLRAFSVGNVIEFKVKDKEDELTYDLSVDLNDIEINHANTIQNNDISINDNLGVKMKYPTPSFNSIIKTLETEAEVVEATIMECIDYVYDDENMWMWKECSDEEKVEFIEQMDMKTYDRIKEFFEVIPNIRHEVKYENSLGHERKVVFNSLDDFFF